MTVEGPEAVEWLKSNGHEAALASNRFESTKKAIEFVELLYTAGARRVIVPADSIWDDEEERELGGAYSDTLLIQIEQGEVPTALLEIYIQEATLEGYDLRKEAPPIVEEQYLVLWWD
ncbi:hypothetical protein [Posidoniimonas corsicana]|uniref:hypothetical protein n=1 Tax=Posidoniimonas corsicana TaxID=1938618 RepID=UPI0011B36F4D|nr:hypothetical protein [Posidoniimonas corsicana]